MIRRPLTEITLKLDDLLEYEASRRDQTNNASTASDMQEGTSKPLTGELKTTEEIQNRIGYIPKKKPSQGTPAGAAGTAPHSPSNANSTPSRPMASTGGTHYGDRTIRRHRESYDIPTMDVNNYQDGLGMGNLNGRLMNFQGVQAQLPIPPSSR